MGGGGLDEGAVHHLHGEMPDQLDAWVDRFRAKPGFGCILCAVHGGPSGRESINRQCNEILGRRIGRKGRFLPGQPVTLGRNHPERNLWNGDLGLVVEEDGELWARFGKVRVRPG
jgi:ATP-dependent exoDNAse (exonuclease V) alpha subunit